MEQEEGKDDDEVLPGPERVEGDPLQKQLEAAFAASDAATAQQVMDSIYRTGSA